MSWIKVKDRLPKHSRPVYVTTIEESKNFSLDKTITRFRGVTLATYETGDYNNNKSWFEAFYVSQWPDSGQLDNVVAWLEEPKPYEGSVE